MANAQLLRVADAVADALNNHAFSMPFTAERVYIPYVYVEHLLDAGLKVWVLPRSSRSEHLTRLAFAEEHLVDVGVCKRVGSEWTMAELDGLVDLVDEIEVYLRRTARNLANADAVCVGVEVNPVFSPEQLLEQHTFLAVLSATYKVHR